MGKIGTVLEFLKIEHTLFALPFVLAGTLIGFDTLGYRFDWIAFLLVIGAATGARTLGMTLNRIVDKAIDARNPRTASRALPAGAMSDQAALVLAMGGAALLFTSAAVLNRLVLALSPVLVALFFAYPYMKRVTWACHFVLGLAFFCAPVGGYLAVTGSLVDLGPPILLGLAAMAWVAGFDVIYALLDVEHDRANAIHSAPADLGEASARRLAAGLHVLVVLLLAIFARVYGLGWPMYAAVAVIGALLAYEHATADPTSPVAINRAFFYVNAVVGWIALAGIVAGLYFS